MNYLKNLFILIVSDQIAEGQSYHITVFLQTHHKFLSMHDSKFFILTVYFAAATARHTINIEKVAIIDKEAVYDPRTRRAQPLRLPRCRSFVVPCQGNLKGCALRRGHMDADVKIRE